jgi:hypothetical protein
MASKPAYAVAAWHTGEAGAGPQCSASGEYCFLCQTHDTGKEGDAVADLKAVVRTMVDQSKELPTIVDAAYDIYNEHIRCDATGVGPTGAPLVSPAWSRASIAAHLLYSTEFPGLFNNVVVQIHQSVIMKLNTEIIANDVVAPAVAEEFRKTVASLKRWQNK